MNMQNSSEKHPYRMFVGLLWVKQLGQLSHTSVPPGSVNE